MSEANPTVRSKFDRSHGKGIKAPNLTIPGGVGAVNTSKSGYPPMREGNVKLGHNTVPRGK